MTTANPRDSRLLFASLLFSLLTHLAGSYSFDSLKMFKPAMPVNIGRSIMVNLQETPNLPDQTPATVSPYIGKKGATPPVATSPVVKSPATSPTSTTSTQPLENSPSPLKNPVPAVPQPIAETPSNINTQPVATVNNSGTPPLTPIPSVRVNDEFLFTKWEKLGYRISTFGIPVGSAQLEAEKEQGSLKITLRVKSSAAMSQLYPVDDLIETRHINGNFIITRIRQQEGGFRGDRGFTLFLHDQSVFWIDRLKNLSIREPLPSRDTVDILSGLYWLRNRPLEIGKPVELKVFDGNKYAPIMVEILRREQLNLPGGRELPTLVIRPLLDNDALFHNAGEMLVWLTDDKNKVPVRIEMTIPLGRVVAELVSADSESKAPLPAQ